VAATKAIEAVVKKPGGPAVQQIAIQSGNMLSNVLSSIAEVQKTSKKPSAGNSVKDGAIMNAVNMIIMSFLSCND
jgi:hypothetical protein